LELEGMNGRLEINLGVLTGSGTDVAVQTAFDAEDETLVGRRFGVGEIYQVAERL
jgi:hypothetical protein